VDFNSIVFKTIVELILQNGYDFSEERDLKEQRMISNIEVELKDLIFLEDCLNDTTKIR